jgi:hypothetical protein
MTASASPNKKPLVTILEDQSKPVPKTMVEALESDDPEAALRALSLAARHQAVVLTQTLERDLSGFLTELPELLTLGESHPVHNTTACADSIHHSLTKIASGGSAASREIRLLEQEKAEFDAHAAAVHLALTLRTNSDRAARALQSQQYEQVAQAITPWLAWHQQQQQQQAPPPGTDPRATHSENDDPAMDPRVRAYAGEYSLQQLSTTYEKTKIILLQNYEHAVQQGDLQALGKYTPILSSLQLESEAVRLYLQFLKSLLQSSIRQALDPTHSQSQNSNGPSNTVPPYVPMAKVYNAAVHVLRHHLPMVSSYLYKAQGDVAVVQLVHVQVEETVLPMLERFQKSRDLASVSTQAQRIAADLEERYTGRTAVDAHDAAAEADDAGFGALVGSLTDVDATMQEVATCLQHVESYLRFVQHTCDQVQKARTMRHEQSLSREWENDGTPVDLMETIEILPTRTNLHLALAEVGGQYASIERCLLMASMQRAFHASEDDPRYYRPLGMASGGTNHGNGNSSFPSKALQTALVETCLYATRRGTQRAFATGHTGTASAMTNFGVDCLLVLLEVLSQRAEEAGVAVLKPGDGLLAGSGGIFNAHTLLRQGTQVSHAVVNAGVTTSAHKKKSTAAADDLQQKQEVERGIARACAMLNDLEVAVGHVDQLESVLSEAIAKGFPPNTHDTEQLQLCVKSLGTVTERFRMASDGTVENLESVLKTRIRVIVADAVGGSGESSGFMGVGSKSTDKVTMRMNYNLDEDAYNFAQLGESYVSRLCVLLDELLEPLRIHLAPRLWDALLFQVMGTGAKRLETYLRKCPLTALGAFLLDADVRDLVSYTKSRLSDDTASSNVGLTKSCPALARLIQIAKLVCVDDLDDVVDLVSASKRKGLWDLKLDDTKAFLCLRVEFEDEHVHELLRLPDEA